MDQMMIDRTNSAEPRSATEVSAIDLLRTFNDMDGPDTAAPSELATGFDPLDTVLAGGLSVGDLCVIGGAPGVGKTILALQMARNMAVAGRRVLYCCYEHDVATLLGRLVAVEVGNLDIQVAAPDRSLVRSSIAAIMAGRWSASHPGAGHPAIRNAMAAIESYGDQLVLAELSTSNGTIRDIHERVRTGEAPYDTVYVDYLQKVGVPGAIQGIDRWTLAVEGLKNLALEKRCLVIALSALDRESLNARRVSLDGFRGADAIAHEADVAIVLNDKLKIVSRSHLAFDTTLYETFSKYTVLTVAKNRRGPAPADMEFRKDFGRFRFDPKGQFVAEQLVDEILIDD